MSTQVWRRKLLALLPRARFDEPLSRHTTFRIGGPADAYAEIQGLAELSALMGLCREEGLSVFFIGWGSNLLIQDGGVRGVVARLRGDFERIEFLDAARVRAGAGVRLPQLVSRCAQKGLGGDESLVGVPGTVGGALVMNAGTGETEIGELVREVSVFDPEAGAQRALLARDLRFEYRGSSLEGRIVLGCVLQLKAGDKVDIMRRVWKHQQKRLLTQPVHTHNVGSTFKNPPGFFVARLIEEAGLKGFSCGGARVSPLHANFIENFKRASARDVLDLVSIARERIKASRGVELELEMKVVGVPGHGLFHRP